MNATEEAKPTPTATPARGRRFSRPLRRLSLSIAAWLMDGVSHSLRFLPPRLRYLPANAITFPLSYVWRRRIISTNYATILRASPDDPGVRAIARESIRNYGRMAIDFLAARTMDPNDVARHAQAEGYENYNDALKDNHGVIFVLPHAGSWDIAAVIAESFGVKITVVTEGDWVTELVSGSRLTHGVTLVPRNHSLRTLFRALSRKEAVVLLSDYANIGVPTINVPFFGKLAPFPDGPARLAYRTGAPLLVISCIRMPDRTYHIAAQAPIRPDPSLSENDNIAFLTAGMAAGFQRVIARHPEHWYPYHPVWP